MTGLSRLGAIPTAIVVMGVAGSGKTTIARLLAARLDWSYQDGDWFHPPANVAKMTAGQPLTDEDRWPWLAAISAWIEEAGAAGRHGVIACSALKRAYRERLIGRRNGAVRFALLKGSRELIQARMALRTEHFMPPSLLDSQFAALEEPGPDEPAITVPIEGPPDAIVGAVLAALGLESETRSPEAWP